MRSLDVISFALFLNAIPQCSIIELFLCGVISCFINSDEYLNMLKLFKTCKTEIFGHPYLVAQQVIKIKIRYTHVLFITKNLTVQKKQIINGCVSM